MEVIDKNTRENHWEQCVEEAEPFVVYFARFGYGLFSYDMTSALVRWTDKAVEKIQERFKALYDNYREDSKYTQVEDFDYEYGPYRGYIVVIDIDVPELFKFLEKLLSEEGCIDHNMQESNKRYRPWQYWPDIAGVRL